MAKLDILSDPICPWCWIGKAQLDRALSARPLHPFVLEWHPFQLFPDMPAGGMDREAFLAKRFGDAQAARAAEDQVVRAAEEAGLSYEPTRVKRLPNTLDAHRLIHWAGIEMRQTLVVSALFRAHFTEGLDIGDAEVLVRIGTDAGLEPELLRRLLSTEEDREAILTREAHSRKMGVQAVPTFIVAERHAVPGAQPAALWEQVIDELAGQAEAPGTEPQQ
ncbi:DsbA family oxidoreductase [Pseudoroseicyclus aestuarii]|uniref:Putative DsbA family dithiol-disulfide isomerase n=1 Tax=Pseudoroseicyclus aestuarii TaxID=1795041 RepID=A0A318T6L4_9RHOB|nr:DsbA family oxidoreductase [Pseudoroseicyclus aestuarii]PYE86094.1 putative DsbA family dithiol-disulfide isomerase [Pseudoroseicyclus aestuarii]